MSEEMVAQPTFTFEGAGPAVALCSKNVCRNGHTWKPKLGLANCPGCGGPVLMVMIQNCPVCNEPVERMELRSDHICNGGGVAAICQGQKVNGECCRIELQRELAKKVEGGVDEKVSV